MRRAYKLIVLIGSSRNEKLKTVLRATVHKATKDIVEKKKKKLVFDSLYFTFILDLPGSL